MLKRLQSYFTLCLWSVSGRRYLDKVLSFGLSSWFAETYSWDELPAPWKDVRRIRADFLIDDSPHHREAAEKRGLADHYVVVPGYGGPEDAADPLAWARLVEQAVGLDTPEERAPQPAETPGLNHMPDRQGGATSDRGICS